MSNTVVPGTPSNEKPVMPVVPELVSVQFELKLSPLSGSD